MSEGEDNLETGCAGAICLVLLAVVFILSATAVRQSRENDVLEALLKTERTRVVNLRANLASAVGEIEALRQQLPDRTTCL